MPIRTELGTEDEKFDWPAFSAASHCDDIRNMVASQLLSDDEVSRKIQVKLAKTRFCTYSG